ncbi:IgA-binding beta antigen [Streptococcus pneumoniae MNZ85]|uniref:GAG-binding domain-containing protein n=1 Tax=Streptococcus pneumoniae TaxID=1313 RepID=UPI0003541510|nr:GAG-binding domain-containing protein [Streptococcus pneumoniae]EPF49628.1 IgA-binding beta antigen [Streptococcus pneumoniae MNZ85]
MSKSNHERRMRYSIRKFSVGVASVAVASLFMGSVVHATENVSANPPIPQIVSPGDKKEYEDAVQRVNKEISDYVTSRLDSLDRSVSGFSEIVTKVQVVVDKYRDKIDRVSTKSMVEELGREVKKKVDEEIKLFQNRSGSKSTPKGLSLNDGLQGGGGDPSVGQGPGVVPQPGGQAGGSMVVPPVTQTPPSTSPSPGQKATEAEKKKLQDLIRQGQEELKKLEDYLREVNNYPELPDNDPDYKVQKKDIWDNSKDTAPKKIQVFKEQLEKQTYTEKTLKDAVAEFIYYQFHAQIETMTRKIATYRKKHPNVAEVERLFSEKLKQTANSTYATLEGEALKTYFERDFLPVFNKIHSIIEELEKKSSQGELKKQDKVAEAQKKVEEAEKKAKAQKEEDRRNYPTNTSKTIELEIAEAQVEVAKAELELAQAQAQTPQDTDKINTAKAKVETAKSKVKTLEKIKSDSGRAQAGDQKPSMPAPDTKPEVKPQPETPKTSKIITASDGKTKVTVVFDKAVDADKVNIKEVTTKELAEKIARQTGGGTVRIFDLSLSKGGKETHVNGERTVRLALGQTASDVHVYHVKENGDLERIPSKVENGQVVFKTNHFSLFAIKTLSKNQNVTTPKQIKPSVQHGQTQIGENQTGKFQNKEVNHKPLATGNETMAKENPTSATEKNLPSTGAATNLVLEIIGLLGLAGTSLIAMKRRK